MHLFHVQGATINSLIYATSQIDVIRILSDLYNAVGMYEIHLVRSAEGEFVLVDLGIDEPVMHFNVERVRTDQASIH